MSTTSKTSEYQLSQVEQNDVPSWISDYSADMAKIDAALANNRNNVSAKFSEDTDYIKGNYCIKDDVLYKFTDAKPAGSWDSTKVEAVTVEGELEAHATAISEQNVNINTIGNKIDFSASIQELPSKVKTVIGFTTGSSEISIGSVTIPRYSVGIYVSGTAAMCIAVSLAKKIIVGVRNSTTGEWSGLELN